MRIAKGAKKASHGQGGPDRVNRIGGGNIYAIEL